VRTLVLGGIRSGKSRWAESAITGSPVEGDAAPHDTVHYIATGRMPEADQDWERRVDAHRRRRPPWWHTVETVDVAAHLGAYPTVPALVDDVGGWLTAVLDHRGWTGGSVDTDVEGLLAAVRVAATDLVLVSPEVGLTVVPATMAGRRFADELGALNQRLADSCDRVVLVVAGQPLQIKPATATLTVPG